MAFVLGFWMWYMHGHVCVGMCVWAHMWGDLKLVLGVYSSHFPFFQFIKVGTLMTTRFQLMQPAGLPEGSHLCRFSAGMSGALLSAWLWHRFLEPKLHLHTCYQSLYPLFYPLAQFLTRPLITKISQWLWFRLDSCHRDRWKAL